MGCCRCITETEREIIEPIGIVLPVVTGPTFTEKLNCSVHEPAKNRCMHDKTLQTNVLQSANQAQFQPSLGQPAWRDY